MRTVEQFQQDVLAPLRKERDEKMMATYDHENSLKANYQRETNEIREDKIAFCKKQKDELKAFQKQQNFDLGIFNNGLGTRKTNAFNIYRKGMHQVKQDRRTINETFQDKIGVAYARYNKERMEAGEAPVVYDKVSYQPKKVGGDNQNENHHQNQEQS